MTTRELSRQYDMGPTDARRVIKSKERNERESLKLCRKTGFEPGPSHLSPGFVPLLQECLRSPEGARISAGFRMMSEDYEG